MGTLFLFGTLWFWILIVVASIAITTYTEMSESNSTGFIILAATFLLLYFGGNSDAFKSFFRYVSQNPGDVVLWVLGYFVLGTIWSFVKWYFHLITQKERLIGKEHAYPHYKDRFDVKENKERILNWMIYWPLSALWTTINQPVRKLFNEIFRKVEGSYQKMSDNITKDLKPKNGE